MGADILKFTKFKTITVEIHFSSFYHPIINEIEVFTNFPYFHDYI